MVKLRQPVLAQSFVKFKSRHGLDPVSIITLTLVLSTAVVIAAIRPHATDLLLPATQTSHGQLGRRPRNESRQRVLQCEIRVNVADHLRVPERTTSTDPDALLHDSPH